MAQKVIIPRLGQTMTEGTVLEWLKQDGDTVQAGDDVYELEYDKATAVIQAKQAGILRILCENGTTVPLGDTVAVILEDGEKLEDIDIKGVHDAAGSESAYVNEQTAQAQSTDQEKSLKARPVLAKPMIRRIAKEMGIDITKVVAENPASGISKKDLEMYAKKNETDKSDESSGESIEFKSKISPMARKYASDLGVDITKITPKDGNRINKEDVISYSKNNMVVGNELDTAGQGKEVEISGIRKVISERMTQSYFTYPTVTLNTDADMTELLKMREQLNEKLSLRNIKLSVTDMLVKAVALALEENAILNTSLLNDKIIYHETINIGIAVALDNGLIVPVIKKADKLSLEEIASEAKRLISLAKEGKIGGADMSGGTFTITNLGTFGIDAFNPIINYPESAILGVGRTVEKPVVLNGNIVVGKRAVLSLTHDHRVVDGVPAANFLKSIVHYIEKPFYLTD